MYEKYKNKIRDFYQDHKRMPVYREIMDLVGFKSPNAAYKLVQKLIQEGVVAKDRTGKLIPHRLFGEIPMLGSVTAGFPAVVEEELRDTVSLDDLLIKQSEGMYMLKVDGDSMIDAHIEDGDLVLVEKTNRAKDGQIVIAEIDGEFTMKYFRQKGEKVWLEPANKKYQPIYPTQDLKITAVVKTVIRQY